jgi:hypothetical protein
MIITERRLEIITSLQKKSPRLYCLSQTKSLPQPLSFLSWRFLILLSLALPNPKIRAPQTTNTAHKRLQQMHILLAESGREGFITNSFDSQKIGKTGGSGERKRRVISSTIC